MFPHVTEPHRNEFKTIKNTILPIRNLKYLKYINRK